jgi:hypothetical protein
MLHSDTEVYLIIFDSGYQTSYPVVKCQVGTTHDYKGAGGYP